MGVDIHRLPAQKPDQRLPALPRKFHRQARRRRNRHDDRNPRRQRLLHDLKRRPPAHQQHVPVERQQSVQQPVARPPCPRRCAGRRPRAPRPTCPWHQKPPPRAVRRSSQMPPAPPAVAPATARIFSAAILHPTRPAGNADAPIRSKPSRKARSSTKQTHAGSTARNPPPPTLRETRSGRSHDPPLPPAGTGAIPITSAALANHPLRQQKPCRQFRHHAPACAWSRPRCGPARGSPAVPPLQESIPDWRFSTFDRHGTLPRMFRRLRFPGFFRTGLPAWPNFFQLSRWHCNPAHPRRVDQCRVG